MICGIQLPRNFFTEYASSGGQRPPFRATDACRSIANVGQCPMSAESLAKLRDIRGRHIAIDVKSYSNIEAESFCSVINLA